MHRGGEGAYLYIDIFRTPEDEDGLSGTALNQGHLMEST